MLLLASTLTGFGLSMLTGGGILARWLNAEEEPADPANLRWHQDCFYETPEELEIMEQCWAREEQLRACWPQGQAEQLNRIARLEVETLRLSGHLLPSELIESEQPRHAEDRARLMQMGAAVIADQDLVESHVVLQAPPTAPIPGVLPAATLRPARRRAATTFMRYWVAAVKQQFEMRQDRPSDRAAMRTWLAKELRAHGVRVTHIARAGPMIVRLALLPDEGDRIAVLAAEEVRRRTRWERLCYNASCWLSATVEGRRVSPPLE